MRYRGRRDVVCVADILEAIVRIIHWRASNESEDVPFRSAILHEIRVSGEAVNRLCDEFRREGPEVPWRI